MCQGVPTPAIGTSALPDRVGAEGRRGDVGYFGVVGCFFWGRINAFPRPRGSRWKVADRGGGAVVARAA